MWEESGKCAGSVREESGKSGNKVGIVGIKWKECCLRKFVPKFLESKNFQAWVQILGDRAH